MAQDYASVDVPPPTTRGREDVPTPIPMPAPPATPVDLPRYIAVDEDDEKHLVALEKKLKEVNKEVNNTVTTIKEDAEKILEPMRRANVVYFGAGAILIPFLNLSCGDLIRVLIVMYLSHFIVCLLHHHLDVGITKIHMSRAANVDRKTGDLREEYRDFIETIRGTPEDESQSEQIEGPKDGIYYRIRQLTQGVNYVCARRLVDVVFDEDKRVYNTTLMIAGGSPLCYAAILLHIHCGLKKRTHSLGVLSPATAPPLPLHATKKKQLRECEGGMFIAVGSSESGHRIGPSPFFIFDISIWWSF